jgi:hypothetical protein
MPPTNVSISADFCDNFSRANTFAVQTIDAVHRIDSHLGVTRVTLRSRIEREILRARQECKRDVNGRAKIFHFSVFSQGQRVPKLLPSQFDAYRGDGAWP